MATSQGLSVCRGQGSQGVQNVKDQKINTLILRSMEEGIYTELI